MIICDDGSDCGKMKISELNLVNFYFVDFPATQVGEEEPLFYTNFDLENVVTPVNVGKLKDLLVASEYPIEKTRFLVDSFTNGFSISYQGDENVKKTSLNLKLRIGNETILWNKMMKEVKEKHFTGPFEKPPFEHFIQSLVGLVPKDDGRKTRLIFHLSYLEVEIL